MRFCITGRRGSCERIGEDDLAYGVEQRMLLLPAERMPCIKMSLMSVNGHASNPSSSINFVTALITSLSRRSIEGFSTFLAMILSTMPLSLEMRTPMRAQPLKRSHPSTTRPRPRVSSSIAPENINSV